MPNGMLNWTMETPPRAWGRLPVTRSTKAPRGNTPTCMGKTYLEVHQRRSLRKHPHVHGEDLYGSPPTEELLETPPRAWGRLRELRHVLRSGEKHPHVHGEDSPVTRSTKDPPETPPRAWGRHRAPVNTGINIRNTPTCMGKTQAREQHF